MTHEEKLKSQPEDTTDHDKLDQLNRELADKFSQLRDAGVAVDSSPADLSDPADRARLRSLLRGTDAVVPPVVNVKVQPQTVAAVNSTEKADNE